MAEKELAFSNWAFAKCDTCEHWEAIILPMDLGDFAALLGKLAKKHKKEHPKGVLYMTDSGRIAEMLIQRQKAGG